MKKFLQCVGATLLMLASSVVGYANEFPPIDANQVKERMMGVNPKLIQKSRKAADNSLQNTISRPMSQKPVMKEGEQSAPTSHVEGLQVWNPNEDYGKWWSFNTATAESTELWYNEMLGGYNINCGFVRNGTIYAVTVETGYILTFDLATGEYKGYISLYGYKEGILHSAYDEKNDKVYVYTYDETGDGMWFQTFDPETRTFELIRTEVGEGTLAEDPLIAMAFNPLDGFIYGITLMQENWIKINPADGKWEVISKLDFSPAAYVQAMVYTPSTFSFSFIGINVSDETWHLVIDPATGNITSSTRMLDEAEYAILYCSDEALQIGAPKAPEILSAEFNPATLSGKVKVAVPNQTTDGVELTGTLQMVATIDDAEYLTQDVAAGSEVELTIENQTEGTHTLTVYCNSASGTKGGSTEYEFWIGYDVPKAPANVVLTETLLTWDNVTESQFGQQMESDVITYNVYISGEKVNAEPITTNSYELNLEVTELTKIKAEVEAVCGSKVSQRTASNEIVVGAYQLPLDLEITKEVSALFTIIDANSDNSTWKWKSSDKALQYYYSSSNDADDWAILPKTFFPEGMRLYSISVDVSDYERYPEKFEVAISKTGKVEDMQIVIPETQVASDAVKTVSGQFKLEEAGEYYIGIHAVSDADCYYLNLYRVAVNIMETPNTVPQACEEIVATAAEFGALAATVEFTMPSLSLGGEALDAEKDITVTLKSDVESVTVTGKPGSRVSGTVKTNQGENTITLVPENEFGFGLEGSVTVYTGVDIPLPATLTSVSVSDDNRTVTFSWETGTVGKNGGFVDPAFVTYKVLIYDAERDYWFLHADCETIEYSYTVPEGTELKMVQLAVTSLNQAGYMEEGPTVTESLGTPHEIPMLELFENQELTYSPVTIEHPTEECSGSWDIVSPSAFVVGAGNETSAALRAFAKNEGNTSAQIALPKFNPQSAQEIVVKVRAFLYEGMANAEVSVRGYNTSVALGTIAMEDKESGWYEFEFMLPAEIKDLQWAELVINAKFTSTAEFLLIDKYEITTFTGVESILNAETVIYTTDNAVVLKNVNVGDNVSIFTPAGETIIADKANAKQMTFELNAGIYIVRCGDKIQKVIVQ